VDQEEEAEGHQDALQDDDEDVGHRKITAPRVAEAMNTNA